jgi:hypothetical protein
MECGGKRSATPLWIVGALDSSPLWFSLLLHV